MFKGKRQVGNKNIFANQSQQSPPNPINIIQSKINQNQSNDLNESDKSSEYFQGNKKESKTGQCQKEYQTQEQTEKIISSLNKTNQVRTSALIKDGIVNQNNENDEKKKRLELLKQKYLKKGTISNEPQKKNITKHQQQIQHNSISEDKNQYLKQKSIQKKLNFQIDGKQYITKKNQLTLTNKKSDEDVNLQQQKQIISLINDPLQKKHLSQEPSNEEKKKKPSPLISNQISRQKQSKLTEKNFVLPTHKINNQASSILTIKNLMAKKLEKHTKKQFKLQQALQEIDVFKESYHFTKQQNKVQPDPEFSLIKNASEQQNLSNKINEQENQTTSQKLQDLNQEQIFINQKTKQNQLKELFLQWISKPLLTFCVLMNLEEKQIQKQHQPKIQSKNPQFVSQIGNMLNCFVIKSTVELNEIQKKTVYQINLQYFYQNPQKLQNIFLIILVKLGKNYIFKHISILQNEENLKQIFYFRKLFSPIQLNQFVQCILDHFFKKTNQNAKKTRHYVWLLFLSSSNDRLFNQIINTKFQDKKVMLALLCVCFLNKNKFCAGIQIVLIGQLTSLFSSFGMIQTVLTRIKSIEASENYYQYSKKVQLKLISQLEENKKQLIDKKQQQKSGLFGYFKKAIQKITTNIEQSKPQPIENENKIIYDSTLKRYTINGQVIEDKTQQKRPQKKFIPPPPPPKAIKPLSSHLLKEKKKKTPQAF